MTSLPPIDDTALPADLRSASRDDKTRYKTALAFERELVTQLTQQLADTAQSTDGGDSSGDESSSAATNSYKQMLPDVLADSVMQSGGLGLARTIAQNLKESGR